MEPYHRATAKVNSAADEKILSYGDVVLRRSDLDILGGPYYLNDRIIEFYFSYLVSCVSCEDILFVSPSVAFWVTNCQDSDTVKIVLEPLKLADRKLIFFTVNDNNDVNQAEGGNHWSLLAFERNSNLFVHHDSSRGMNRIEAKQLYKKVVGLVGTSSDGSYVECIDLAQQQNGYDCGLYVTAIAKSISSWYVNGGAEAKESEDLWFPQVDKEVTPSHVTQLRNDILGLIRDRMVAK